MAKVPPARFGVEADTMERFLDVLHRRFGGAGAWALGSVGVADGHPSTRMRGGPARVVLGEAAAGPGDRADAARDRVTLYTGTVTASMWVPILAGTAMFLALMTGRSGGHRVPAVETGPSQMAGVPLPRRRHRRHRPVGGRRRPPTARGRADLSRGGRTVDRRSGPQGALAFGRPGRRPPCGRLPRSMHPTAELPSLCRRLQAAAVDLDKVLRVEPAGPVTVDLRTQVHRGDAGRR